MKTHPVPFETIGLKKFSFRKLVFVYKTDSYMAFRSPDNLKEFRYYPYDDIISIYRLKQNLKLSYYMEELPLTEYLKVIHLISKGEKILDTPNE